MTFLSNHDRETLRHICDTFVPKLVEGDGDDQRLADFCARDVGIAEQIEATVGRIGGAAGQRRLIKFLALIDSRLMNGFMAGLWDRFAELSLDERTQVLNAWSASRWNSARQAFQALKRLTLFTAYASSPAGGNPAWPVFEYDGCANAAAARSDAARPATQRPIAPLEIAGRDSLDADVLVVGSGAGGGVVAAELSAAGLDVLVVEKGFYFGDHEFTPNEQHGMHQLYEREGSLATSDMSIVVLAGSTLGGGTTVNWMTSLEPPPDVLQQWSREFGFTAATSDAFQQSIRAVCSRLNVNTNESQLNGSNAALDRGCRELGYRCSVIPRNAKNCGPCDFCSYGCAPGGKQDTRRTFLQDAFDRGARILTGATVERVRTSGGRATGAELNVRTADGVRRVTVQCQAVVVAAGSIHTPAILRRSGLTNPHIGANLHLHPTTAVFAAYPDKMHPWQGVPQSRVCDEFANLDGRGYGVRLETCPAHPGLSAMAMPWMSGRQHKRLVQSLHYMANIIILTRDKHTGRVTLDRAGQPVMHYRLSSYDASHMLRGVVEALRIQRAAGATTVYSPHANVLAHDRADAQSFDDYLNQVRHAPIRRNSFGLFSAHQLSTCRIAGSKSQGAVTPEGETYEVKNLYITDASALPCSCGVNPMITIMSTAHSLAQNIKARLT